jgi:hypothetical protein
MKGLPIRAVIAYSAISSYGRHRDLSFARRAPSIEALPGIFFGLGGSGSRGGGCSVRGEKPRGPVLLRST